MPRPKKNKEISQIESPLESLKKDVDSLNLNPKPMNNEAQKPSPAVNDEEWTVSPDGKHKLPKFKPHSHGFDLDLGDYNIDYSLQRTGYQIAWLKDEKPHEMAKWARMGYEFIDPNCPEANGRELIKHGGYREDGSAYHLYAMQIPDEVFKARKAKEHGEIKTHETSQGLYSTQDMKLGTGYQHGYLVKNN